MKSVKMSPEDIAEIQELMEEKFGSKKFAICYLVADAPPPVVGEQVPTFLYANGVGKRELRLFQKSMEFISGRLERIDREKAKSREAKENSVDKLGI